MLRHDFVHSVWLSIPLALRYGAFCTRWSDTPVPQFLRSEQHSSQFALGGGVKISVLHGNGAFMLDGIILTVAAYPMHAHAPSLDEHAHPRLDAALKYIHRHLGEPLRLPFLAQLSRLSVGRFVTVFRLTVGVTPHRYIYLKRIHRAQCLLGQGHTPALAAHECGFYDQSHLTRCLKSQCGMTPRQFQTAMKSASAGADHSP